MLVFVAVSPEEMRVAAFESPSLRHFTWKEPRASAPRPSQDSAGGYQNLGKWRIQVPERLRHGAHRVIACLDAGYTRDSIRLPGLGPHAKASQPERIDPAQNHRPVLLGPQQTQVR